MGALVMQPNQQVGIRLPAALALPALRACSASFGLLCGALICSALTSSLARSALAALSCVQTFAGTQYPVLSAGVGATELARLLGFTDGGGWGLSH